MVNPDPSKKDMQQRENNMCLEVWVIKPELLKRMNLEKQIGTKL